MWTVSKLAARCGLSRGTLLYYESIGLLKPPRAAPPITGGMARRICGDCSRSAPIGTPG